jgi:hypothetical protein
LSFCCPVLGDRTLQRVGTRPGRRVAHFAATDLASSTSRFANNTESRRKHLNRKSHGITARSNRRHPAARRASHEQLSARAVASRPPVATLIRPAEARRGFAAKSCRVTPVTYSLLLLLTGLGGRLIALILLGGRGRSARRGGLRGFIGADLRIGLRIRHK